MAYHLNTEAEAVADSLSQDPLVHHVPRQPEAVGLLEPRDGFSKASLKGHLGGNSLQGSGVTPRIQYTQQIKRPPKKTII